MSRKAAITCLRTSRLCCWVVFDPFAAADPRNIVQTIVDNLNVAITGQAEWYPVAFFLRDENGEVLGGLLGGYLGGMAARLAHLRTRQH
jgi:hypothetical protein